MDRGIRHEHGQTSTEYVLVLATVVMLAMAMGAVLTTGAGGAVLSLADETVDAFLAALP